MGLLATLVVADNREPLRVLAENKEHAGLGSSSFFGPGTQQSRCKQVIPKYVQAKSVSLKFLPELSVSVPQHIGSSFSAPI